MGGVIMGKISNDAEEEWLRRATDAAVAGARKVVAGGTSLGKLPIESLSDQQLAWIVTAGIFAWVGVRVEQATAAGLDAEHLVRRTGLNPDPCDVAVVKSILPVIADQAGIDWSLPLASWSKDLMTNFLLLAWELLDQAEYARDTGPVCILKPSGKPVFDEGTGDPIPF
jgi:hypothetical protein